MTSIEKYQENKLIIDIQKKYPSSIEIKQGYNQLSRHALSMEYMGYKLCDINTKHLEVLINLVELRVKNQHPEFKEIHNLTQTKESLKYHKDPNIKNTTQMVREFKQNS